MTAAVIAHANQAFDPAPTGGTDDYAGGGQRQRS